VISALDRLQRRGLAELERDYVPYLDREYVPDYPDDDHQLGLHFGEAGIRLILQRIAQSSASADRLAELIAANAQDEHRELMWGSAAMTETGFLGERAGVPGQVAAGSKQPVVHGTAGNGYAFLALLERTGDELWLERARAFAMHAAAQVVHAREAHGQGRFTLWTGDPGVALYLADCLAGGGELPLP
jgi:hypothetical protein